MWAGVGGQHPERTVLVRSAAVGTGYQITNRLVLTAQHVLRDGEQSVVQWRDGTDTAGTVVWTATDADVALLEIDRLPGAPAAPTVRWGVLSSAAAHVPVETHGFPQFMAEGQQRDYEQVTGFVHPLSALGQAARLDIHVASKQWREGLGEPWRGMSGAPVFAGGCLVGVVVMAAGGSQRIAMVPVDAFAADEGFQEAVRRAGGPEPVLEPADLQALVRPWGVPASLHSVSHLLRAPVAALPYRPAQDLLERLRAWTALPGFGCRLLIGSSGAGKSRVAAELAKELHRAGWVAAFARDYERGDEQWRENLARLARLHRPALIVVDYAETQPDIIADLTEVMSASPGALPAKLLLVARSAGPWWTALRGASAQLEAALAKSMLDIAVAQPIPQDQRREVYAEAVQALAPLLTLNPGYQWPEDSKRLVAIPDLSSPERQSLPAIQAAALAALLSALDGDPEQYGRTPEEAILGHERRYWTKTARERRIDCPANDVGAAFALAALCTAQTRTEAERLLTGSMPHLGAGKVRGLAGLIHELTGAHAEAYWPAADSLLTELLLTSMTDTDSFELPRLAKAATDRQLVHAITVLVRTAVKRYQLAAPARALMAAAKSLDFNVLVAIAAASPVPHLAASMISQARPEEAETHQGVLRVLTGKATDKDAAAAKLLRNAYLSTYSRSPERLAQRAAANAVELAGTVHGLRRSLRGTSDAIDALHASTSGLNTVARAVHLLADFVATQMDSEAAQALSSAQRAAPSVAAALEPVASVAGNLPTALNELLQLHDGLAVLERDVRELAAVLEENAEAVRRSTASRDEL
jgi:RecA/RadA recombinase